MSLLLDALNGTNESGRPPVWLMRQAGRYLSSYRKLRETGSILEMFRTPELIIEVTMLPLPVIEPDGAILFSDILIVLDALGIEWDIAPNKGPVVTQQLEIEKVKSANESYPFLRQAIVELRRRLTVPLIGFCGGPLTVASYIIEGGSSKDLLKTRRLMLQEPLRFHRLMERVTDALIELILFQIDAGVEVVQIFESWANHLSPSLFQQEVLLYLQRIVAAVDKRVPTLLFCRGSTSHARSLSRIGATGLSLDSSCDIGEMRDELPSDLCLQGNLDPSLLYANRPRVRRECQAILEKMEGDPRFIFNLGHGVYPDVPVENVQELIATIRESAVCRA
jgi:uroporphyrinogen decarboxylase